MPETQLRGRQIASGEINNTHLAAGAGIATSKLADGSEFVKRNGSIAFTGDQSFGNNKATNLATPTASSDAATKGYVDSQMSGLSSVYKYRSARLAMTSNVNISNPGTSTFDGATANNNDRILLAGQTAQAENGVYIFNGSGSAMTRASDFDAWNEFTGAMVSVNEGSANGDASWKCWANDGGTLGTTALVFTKDVSSGLNTANFVDKEVPAGSINGSNTAFTLVNTPTAGSEHLYLNGVLLRSGSGNDYTISGATITMTTAPVSGEFLQCSYRK